MESELAGIRLRWVGLERSYLLYKPSFSPRNYGTFNINRQFHLFKHAKGNMFLNPNMPFRCYFHLSKTCQSGFGPHVLI